jgi:hypothetical protein
MERMYKYRRIVPLTYEQYLDEPHDVIEWTLRIDALQPKEGGSGGDNRPA